MRIHAGGTRASRARFPILGTRSARGTVANILKREGIEPAPTRGTRTPWSVFLKAHWRSLVAADFLTVEVWKLRGLITYYVLFFIEAPPRTVRIAGITPNPAEGWMLQIARNACDVDDGVLSEGRKLPHRSGREVLGRLA